MFNLSKNMNLCLMYQIKSGIKITPIQKIQLIGKIVLRERKVTCIFVMNQDMIKIGNLLIKPGNNVYIKKPEHFFTNYTSVDIENRVKKAGIHLSIIQYVLSKTLGPAFTNSELLSLASLISNGLGIYIDRMAKRNKNALMCWFSENWMMIYPYIRKQMSKDYSINHKRINENNNTEHLFTTFDPTDVLQLLNKH